MAPSVFYGDILCPSSWPRPSITMIPSASKHLFNNSKDELTDWACASYFAKISGLSCFANFLHRALQILATSASESTWWPRFWSVCRIAGVKIPSTVRISAPKKNFRGLPKFAFTIFTTRDLIIIDKSFRFLTVLFAFYILVRKNLNLLWIWNGIFVEVEWYHQDVGLCTFPGSVYTLVGTIFKEKLTRKKCFK
jgi:hypothetical protein